MGLYKKDTHINDVVKHIIEELEFVKSGCKFYHAVLKDYIVAKIFVAQFIADMPQRNATCGCKAPGADYPCCHCILHKKMFKGDAFGDIRNVEQTRAFYDACLKMKSKTEIEDFCKSKGIAPSIFYKSLPHKKIAVSYQENPFWKLKEISGFDIHVDSVVDLFHVEFLGLLVDHTEFMLKYLFSERERNQIYERVKDFKIAGESLPPMKYYKFWNG